MNYFKLNCYSWVTYLKWYWPLSSMCGKLSHLKFLSFWITIRKLKSSITFGHAIFSTSWSLLICGWTWCIAFWAKSVRKKRKINAEWSLPYVRYKETNDQKQWRLKNWCKTELNLMEYGNIVWDGGYNGERCVVLYIVCI